MRCPVRIGGGAIMLVLLAGWLALPVPSNAVAKDLASLGSAAPGASIQAIRRHALVVGAARYAAGELAYALDDARAMARKLESVGFQVRTMEDVSGGELEQALIQLGDRAAAGDMVFFYFAGHTVTAQDRLMLVPVDATVGLEGEPMSGTIAMDRVIQSLGRTRNDAPKLVVLDTSPYPVTSRYRGIQVGPQPAKAPPTFLIAHSNGLEASVTAGSELSVFTQELLNFIATPDRRAARSIANSSNTSATINTRWTIRATGGWAGRSAQDLWNPAANDLSLSD